MLYLIADKYGTVHEIVDGFLEAEIKVRDDDTKFFVGLSQKILNDIERKGKRHLKIVQFVDSRKRGIWEVEFFSDLSEDELQKEVNEVIEELDKTTFAWTVRDILRLLEERERIKVPKFSIERYKITI